jgi:hypothetical protein
MSKEGENRFRKVISYQGGIFVRVLVPISDAELTASKKKPTKVIHTRSPVPSHRLSPQGSTTMTGFHVKRGRTLIRG